MLSRNIKIQKQYLLQFPKGEMLGLLGRNGAGKTTTFRMILVLTKRTEDLITHNGEIIDES